MRIETELHIWRLISAFAVGYVIADVVSMVVGR